MSTNASRVDPAVQGHFDVLATAYAHHAAGRFSSAETLAKQVIAADPDNAHALHLVGEVALRRGDLDMAIALVTRATECQPQLAETHNTLGAALKAAGRLDMAADCYHRAIRLKPDFAQAQSNLGELLIALERPEEAVATLGQALRADPASVHAHNNLGVALMALERYDEAIASLDRAVALDPRFASAWTNLGNAYRAAGQACRASEAHARAVSLQPDRADHHMNHGNSLRELGDLAGAVAAFRRAVVLAPDAAAPHNNLGGALLMSEAWAEGWAEYEWRWRLGDNPKLRARYPWPLWAGERLAGRSILLWAEQGIGDVLLFATMLPDLLRTGAKVSLELDARLLPLFARSFPQVQLFATGAVSHDLPCDTHANIGRLGLFLRHEAQNFATSVPYLVPDPARVATFRRRYAGAGPIIGLSWRSTSASHKRKSLMLDHFAPLFAALPQARFISLQYGDTAAERTAIKARFGVELLHDDSFDNWGDLDGLAAQIAALDAVVSVSNLNVHLAGAMGVPAHVLLTQNSLWYWPHGKTTSSWYESLTLHRAHASLEALARALAAQR